MRLRSEIVAPDFGAGVGIERDHAISGRQVHHAIDDDGRDFVHSPGGRSVRVGPQLVGPSLRELRHVTGVDLFQCRIARGGQVAIVTRPVSGRLGEEHRSRNNPGNDCDPLRIHFVR